MAPECQHPLVKKSIFGGNEKRHPKVIFVCPHDIILLH
jgi:hypothetical protein